MERRWRILGGLALGTLVLDQLTKWWAMQSIPEYGSVPVIRGLFDLVNIRNRGAAFGFLNSPDIEWQFWLFLAAPVFAAFAIVSLARAARPTDVSLFTGLGCVLGGALGNLVDRLRFRAVVDFLDFYVGDWHWPAFNVADIAICLGAGFVCLYMLRTPTHKAGQQAGAAGQAGQSGKSGKSGTSGKSFGNPSAGKGGAA